MIHDTTAAEHVHAELLSAVKSVMSGHIGPATAVSVGGIVAECDFDFDGGGHAKVRAAIDALESDGLLIRSDGGGYYLAREAPDGAEWTYRDERTMRYLYHEVGMTQEEIADVFETTAATVSRWMNKHGVGTRSQRADIDGDELRRVYVDECWKLSEIVGHFDVSAPKGIYMHLQDHGIPRRNLSLPDVRGRDLPVETAGDLPPETDIYRTTAGTVHLYDDCPGVAIATDPRETVAGNAFDSDGVCKTCVCGAVKREDFGLGGDGA